MLETSHRKAAAAIAAAAPVTFLAVFFAWPLVRMVHRAFSSPGIAGPSTSIDSADVVQAAVTTLALAGAGTVVTLVVGLPAVWALHRRAWRGSSLVEALLTAPFALPTVVVALAFLVLQRDSATWLGAAEGLPAIVGALAFFNVAVMVRTVGPALDRVDGRLLAVASTLGAPPSKVTMSVVWPAVRRSVAAATGLTFLFCSTSFALVLLLGGSRVNTLETRAYLEITTFLDLRGAAIIAAVQAVIVTTVLVTISRITRSKGAAPLDGTLVKEHARRGHVPWIVVALAPSVALIGAPMAALAQRALVEGGRPTLRFFSSLWGDDSGSADLGEALISSVLLATAAGGVACLLGTLAAASAALHPRMAWVTGATAGPLAVSSVVVGVGLLLALAVPMRSWDSGTWLLLVAAQTLIALPIVVRIISPVLQGIDARQLAAAATLGASPRRVAVRIVAPRVLPAMGAAAGIAFAVAVGEFGASVFLTRPDAPTLPTTILTVLSRPGPDSMATAAAGAVVLALVTASAMLAADLATKRRAS